MRKEDAMNERLLERPEYGFLRTDPHLGRHLILLGLAGSYSYGTNNENKTAYCMQQEKCNGICCGKEWWNDEF